MELLQRINKYSLTLDNINFITKKYNSCNDISDKKRNNKIVY